MSRRIRTLAIRIAPALAGLILAQASLAFADTIQQTTLPPAQPQQPAPQRPASAQQAPAQPQQNQAQQNPAPQPQRQVQQTYRRGVTPPPISNLTLPSIGPSNYTVAHSERTYWGTAERHPAPQLYPQLPGMGQPAPTQPPVNTASVYRYLPSSASAASASPFGPPLPAVNAQP